MSRTSKRESLPALRGRYQRVGRRFKSKILDEFCAVCGSARKYAIGLLNRNPRLRQRKPGPKRKYAAVLAPLKALWLLSEQMCSKRLKAALPIWLPFYEAAHGALAPTVREQLLRVSPATLDRLLKTVRARYPRQGRSGTRCGPEARKPRIPGRADNRDIDQPGFLEADSVAHCGDSMAGEFVWSRTVTDLFSQWTETRAVWNKSAAGVVDRVREVEAHLPFALKGFAVDNGPEFLPWPLWRYFLHRAAPVDLRRSRPCKKNDQAQVEQKNWTHVRQLLGYERIEGPERVQQSNALSVTWGLLHNFFCPTLQLQSQTRIGSRTVRKYGPAQTPCERVLASPHLSEEQKAQLRARRAELNPIRLKSKLEEQVKRLFDLMRTRAARSGVNQTSSHFSFGKVFP